ncbi:methyltransferase type 12 [Parafrankia colletiae]|uniref:Methyltransferase type 12 n=1 Tax=Parafrankia colletiae TaxID=573497 RepID=A0A1S1R233_9ACTN|nr:methyltransferase domain-containing protein [Parafrankia colletiae]MCK9899482.1 methyltransferase domain-containing protein [Frankia sp. Cpl3]OHV38774.1 methyltransferase type 12 [Parafrankia colletiae]
MIHPALRLLRCPVCAAPLDGPAGPAGPSGLRCGGGHAFDVERSGYLNLRTGQARRVTGDTAEMVQARVDFLGRGHYAPLTARLARLASLAMTSPGGVGPAGAGEVDPELVLEIGAGTAHHLSAVVDARPRALGLAVDVSKPALRRAARAHARVGAVAFDVARPWPLPDRSVDVLLDVFAPRNLPEMRRLLRPGGVLLLVTPGDDHLVELRGPLGLVGIHPGKRARLAEDLAGRFTRLSSETLTRTLRLGVDELVELALMGPTGHHTGAAELRRRLEAVLPAGCTAMEVTASFVIDRAQGAAEMAVD